MRRHRFPVLGSTLMAGAVLLAACGGGDAATGGDTGGGGDGGEPSGELVVWHYYDEGAGGLERAIAGWETGFEEAYPDVDVRLEYQPYDQMVQKVTTAAAAQQGPDIVMNASPFIPEMVKAGALAPMDEYWDAYEEADQYPAEVQDGLRVDDELYAVQAYANVEGVYYNADILSEIGVEVPTDLDELEAAMAAAQEAGYTGMTVSAPAGAGGEFAAVPWLAGSGWSYDEPDAAGAEEALTRLSDWVEAGYINPDDSTGFNGGTNFITGDYAFAQEGNWNLATFAEEADFEYGVAVFPGVDTAAVGGESASIGSGAEDPDLAWRFIEEQILSEDGNRSALEAGSVPLRQDLVDDPALAENEPLQAYAEIAGQSITIPLDDATPQVSELIGSAFNEVIAGRIDGAEAAERIATQLPELRPGS